MPQEQPLLLMSVIVTPTSSGRKLLVLPARQVGVQLCRQLLHQKDPNNKTKAEAESKVPICKEAHKEVKRENYEFP